MSCPTYDPLRTPLRHTETGLENTTAVTDAVTWALYETEIRDRLGIPSPDRDTQLQRLLIAATCAADAYLNNAFADGVPGDVLEGVFLWLEMYWHLNGGGPVAPGLMSVKTGDNAETYGGTGLDAAAAPLTAAKVLWSKYRRNIWR